MAKITQQQIQELKDGYETLMVDPGYLTPHERVDVLFYSMSFSNYKKDRAMLDWYIKQSFQERDTSNDAERFKQLLAKIEKERETA